MLRNQNVQPHDLRPGEPSAGGEAHGCQPKLRHQAIPLHMDMRWLVAVAGIKEETEWSCNHSPGLTRRRHPDGMQRMNSIARTFRLLLCSAFLLRTQAAQTSELPALAAAALVGDTNAIGKLRAAGPPGLEALFAAGNDGITALRQNQSRLEAPENAPLRTALDGVARQRDAFASGLYWFTDLEAAKAEAKKTGRPILSLRLLGNLDDEFSCANSRFFRTSLYANRSVSALLRRGYVLHWKSVRPVPVLTIDMGDGRRIKRTITGNSIHYILNADGHVLDALPGNYGPAAFIAALQRVEQYAVDKSAEERRAWHGSEAHTLCEEWLADAVNTGIYGEKAQAVMLDSTEAQKLLMELRPNAFPAGKYPTHATIARTDIDKLITGALPTPLSRFGGELRTPMIFEDAFVSSRRKQQGADTAGALLESTPLIGRLFRSKDSASMQSVPPFPYPTEFDPPKGMVERPLLKQSPAPAAEAALDLAARGAEEAAIPLTQRMTNERWARIAVRHRDVVWLDESSRRFMIAKLPSEMLREEEVRAGFAQDDKSPLARMLENFESAIARDMVRNEYYFHTLIHQWLEEDKDGALARDVEALNKRVYAELFLTPDYDEWLGLVPEDTYTALEKDGCACDKNAPPMRTTKSAR